MFLWFNLDLFSPAYQEGSARKKNSLRTADVKDIQAILKCSHSFIGALILPGQRKTSTDSRPSICRCGLPVSE